MKKINLITGSKTIKNTVLISAVFMACVLLIALLFMISDASFMKKSIAGVNKRLENTHEKAKEARAKKAVIDPEFAFNTLKKVNAINAMGLKKTISVTEMLYKVEKASPAGVSLKDFNCDRQTGAVLIKAVSSGPELIPVFLNALNKSGMFTAIELEKQEQKKGADGSQQTYFNITAAEAYK